MGGQTALNCALDLGATACWKIRRRDDRCQRRAIDKAEDRSRFDKAMTSDIGLARPVSGTPRHGKGTACWKVGFPASSVRPSPWAAPAAASPTTVKSSVGNLQARPGSVADQRAADRRIADRLEGIRDGGGPRQEGQLHHRLLHRELRPDGRAHRRLRSPSRRRRR